VSTLIFDCDGVLADTERHGHLPAFNQAFREFGLPVQWSEEEDISVNANRSRARPGAYVTMQDLEACLAS
jgi:beta-phosphoglucomutase-like phosphatase (HAD superfamily)